MYRATIRFGARTTTDDPEGEVIFEAPPPPQDIVERAIGTLTGHLLQRPPVFSAKRVAGVRAYAAARRGEPMQLEPVAVTVHEWKVLGRVGPDLDVEIRCNGGTYVRALARDLGEATGSAAHLVALRRLRSGRYEASAGITLDELDRGEFELGGGGPIGRCELGPVGCEGRRHPDPPSGLSAGSVGPGLVGPMDRPGRSRSDSMSSLSSRSRAFL